jgi:hypothetical protein
MTAVPLLDLNEVRTAIYDFNRDANNVAWDAALHQAIDGAKDLTSVPLVVFAVNYFWNANLELRPGTLPFYCETLFRDANRFKSRFLALRSYGLPIFDDELLRLRLVEPACELLMDLLGKPDGATHYAFATKLLFWTADMPPFDSRMQRTVLKLASLDLYPSSNDKSEVRSKYVTLITLYNTWLKQLSDAHLDRDLIEYDFITQPEYLRRRNTLVRVVDKYLWFKGMKETS